MQPQVQNLSDATLDGFQHLIGMSDLFLFSYFFFYHFVQKDLGNLFCTSTNFAPSLLVFTLERFKVDDVCFFWLNFCIFVNLVSYLWRLFVFGAVFQAESES